MTNASGQRNRIKLIVLMTVLSVIAVSCWKTKDPAKDAKLKLTAIDQDKTVALASETNYGRFLHTVEEHEGIDCNSCHSREGTKLKYAGHSSCIDCHFREFVDSKAQVCSICHTNSPETPEELLAFPARFNEGFNMSFDHAQHSKGSANPAQGCAACHLPQGAQRTISVGISTHAQCFTCHTPDSNIGSCNTCHEIAPYSRVTKKKSAVLKYVFSHADHTSRQGVSCVECHSTVANAPQGNQILFPIAVQHTPGRAAKGSVTCASCHNNRRAFGERDFADCKRCHTRSGFSLLPN